jgi:Mycothiol maleylpyruvate isomerase N-terminal domain
MMDPNRAPSHVAYRTTRQNIADLVLVPRDVAGVQVPACPEWTVRDLVAHVAGNCVSRVGQPMAGNDAGLVDILDVWQRAAEEIERGVAAGTEDIGVMLVDSFTHELDLHAALGVSPPADHPAYPWAFDVVVDGLDRSITAQGIPALRLVCNEASWVVGACNPTASLTATRYDLYRSLTGRRTAEQIGELDWSEDPSLWLPGFYWGPFAQPGRRGD